MRKPGKRKFYQIEIIIIFITKIIWLFTEIYFKKMSFLIPRESLKKEEEIRQVLDQFIKENMLLMASKSTVIS